MTTVASAKGYVMKEVIPAVKRCLLLAGRPRDFAVSTLCRRLSTAAAGYSPKEDSSTQDDKQSSNTYEIGCVDLPLAFYDPFYPVRSLGFDNPFLAASRGTGDVSRGGSRKQWEVIEDKNALHLRLDMPGLGKENVKVYAEENALVIKGEALSEADLDESAPKYNSRIELSAKVYRLDQIKAQMKNGVVKVIVPKFTEEEIKNVINVQVE